ncbi:MAG: DMT family transporter [Azoarcus sp.]|nr:DMT family transporter [Azoarcus sp.]
MIALPPFGRCVCTRRSVSRAGGRILRIAVLTTLAMLAFAANSILCRLALRDGDIDPASFTFIRMLSGALVLWVIVRVRARDDAWSRGDWRSAAALFAYAVAFSYAYIGLSAGAGALLLFGAVQATMILTALVRGERMSGVQWAGFALAVGGLLVLLSPGLTAPPWFASLLMIAAGIAWGVYSLRGRGNTDPLATTAGNFLRSVPMVLVLVMLAWPWLEATPAGIVPAVLSGALASGIGYAVWYAALPRLAATSAATVQLSVPVIAAAGGAMLLAEPLTLRLMLASVATLGGIWLVIRWRRA